MSDHPALDAYIAEQLNAAFKERIIELGYWCPRCDILAPPLKGPTTDADLGVIPGWCSFCGLNPRTPGPAPEPSAPQGIRT